jgi:hypothetical protein
MGATNPTIAANSGPEPDDRRTYSTGGDSDRLLAPSHGVR